MSGRLFRSLALLYPKTWRERYADEVADLSAELLAAGEVNADRGWCWSCLVQPLLSGCALCQRRASWCCCPAVQHSSLSRWPLSW